MTRTSCLLAALTLFAAGAVTGFVAGRNRPSAPASIETASERAATRPPDSVLALPARAGRGLAAAVIAWNVPIGAALVVVIASGVLYRRRRRLRRGDAIAASRSIANSHGRDYLERCEAAADAQAAEAGRYGGRVTRALARNPFGAEFTGLTLAQRVQIAAEASARAGRRFGAVVLPLASARPGDGEGLAPSAPLSMDRLVAQIRLRIRPSDYACAADGNRILVFLSLINNRDDLASIAERLRRESVAMLRDSGASHERIGSPGIAIYPLDGYGADELYESACGRAALPEPQARRASA